MRLPHGHLSFSCSRKCNSQSASRHRRRSWLRSSLRTSPAVTTHQSLANLSPLLDESTRLRCDTSLIMAHALPAPPVIPLTAQEATFQQHVAFILSTVRTKGRLPEGREVTDEWHKRFKLPKTVRFHGLRAKYRKDKRKRDWYEVPANLLGVGHDHNQQQAKQARIRLDDALQPWMAQRVHTLGWGGLGIACLFRGRVIPGTPPDLFVAKCNMNQTPAYAAALREERTKQRVRRETHVAK